MTYQQSEQREGLKIDPAYSDPLRCLMYVHTLYYLRETGDAYNLIFLFFLVLLKLTSLYYMYYKWAPLLVLVPV